MYDKHEPIGFHKAKHFRIIGALDIPKGARLPLFGHADLDKQAIEIELHKLRSAHCRCMVQVSAIEREIDFYKSKLLRCSFEVEPIEVRTLISDFIPEDTKYLKDSEKRDPAFQTHKKNYKFHR